MIDCSHIPISVAINDSLRENSDPEALIEAFVKELTHRQEIISKEVWKIYPVVDESSLPKRVQETCTRWVNQVPIFGFNSGEYHLNLVKEHFVKPLSNMNDVTVAKKDTSYMFLTTPSFKFLDVKNYLVSGLSYDGWCKAKGCKVSKLIFSYKWLDNYNKLTHVRPVEYENFYSKLKGGFTITLEEYAEFARKFHSRDCITMMDWLRVYNKADIISFIKAVNKTR